MISLRIPFAQVYPITQEFSWQHSGIDWGAPMHTPVLAGGSGKVGLVRFQANGYGLYVILEHPDQFTTLYAHLEEVLVSAGEEVQEGQVLGYSGSSGNSTGSHLHFELRQNGKTPVNPIPYFKALEPGNVLDSLISQPPAAHFAIGEKVILKEDYSYVNLRPLPAYGLNVADIGDYCGGAALEVLDQQGEMIAVKVWIHAGYVRSAAEIDHPGA